MTGGSVLSITLIRTDVALRRPRHVDPNATASCTPFLGGDTETILYIASGAFSNQRVVSSKTGSLPKRFPQAPSSMDVNNNEIRQT